MRMLLLHRNQPPSLATVLLHDPMPKVRHSAAVTIATLMEGAAQRAYLGIAETPSAIRQATRCECVPVKLRWTLLSQRSCC